MLDNKALTELADTVVRRQFSNAVIHAVAVKPDVDHDGDAILRVTVMVGDGIERLDPERVADTLGRLWFELGEAGVDSFPIVSYMSKADAAELSESV